MLSLTKFPAESPGAPTHLAPPDYRGVEVVIPFTGMVQAQAALRHASRLCSGLDASIRIVRVLVVPYPLDLDHPPSSVAFAAEQLASLSCELPLTLDIRLSRERVPALFDSLADRSLVLMATKRRWWRTKEQRLARALKHRGHQVLLSYEDSNHA